MACRTVRAKRELVRIVRSPSGELGVDLRGKLPGRGAYLCPESERGCLDKGVGSGVLKAALETEIGDDARTRLANELRVAAQERLKTD